MPLLLFALFLAVPLIEIALFIVIGDEIGLWPTLGLVLLTAIIGTTLIRLQSFQVIRQARAKADRGEAPVAEMGHGLGLIIAGVLLITPGFFTDALGAVLLVPGLRRRLGQLIAGYVVARAATQSGRHPPPRPEDDIIDGDYKDVTDQKPANKMGKPGNDAGRPPRLAGEPADDTDKNDRPGPSRDSPWSRR